MLKKAAKKTLKRIGFKIVKIYEPEQKFHSNHYLRHNARRLEHLSSLRIPVTGMTVLEVGAGIGDHSHYYIDRDCSITITESRKENIEYLQNRYSGIDIQFLDMDHPHPLANGPFDIIHCYGLLYHLRYPEKALEFLSQHCKKILFLETCVSFGEDAQINLTEEKKADPSQSCSGMGCRPTRRWVLSILKKHFENVYIPKTQPNHEEFPLDWTSPEKHKGLSRSIFIASRSIIANDILVTYLLNHQIKHE